MKNKYILLFLTGIFIYITTLSCSKNDAEDENNTTNKDTTFRIGLLTSTGNFHDKAFNQSAFEGLLASRKNHYFKWDTLGDTLTDISEKIKFFTDKSYDLIITLGYPAADAAKEAALSKPDIKFILIDHAPQDIPANMACLVFQTDQAAFPAGYLSAYWARKKNPFIPKVAYVAGPAIPPVNYHTIGFTSGVDYYNQQFNTEIGIMGVNLPSFTDSLAGANAADSLIAKGAQVVYTPAGITGNGALYKVHELGKTGVGVDTDQYNTLPEVSSIMLTSVVKHIDKALKQEIDAIFNKEFHGGMLNMSNLVNEGVGMAPLHDFDKEIPSAVKLELFNILEGIKNGTINTGI